MCTEKIVINNYSSRLTLRARFSSDNFAISEIVAKPGQGIFVLATNQQQAVCMNNASVLLVCILLVFDLLCLAIPFPLHDAFEEIVADQSEF